MKQIRYIGFGACVLCAVLLLAAYALEDMPAFGWGLSFPNEGSVPVGPVSGEKLGEYDAAYVDPDGGKVLYLTFDAGYENGYTGDILDVLKKHQVPAAFFLVADYLERNADLVRRMAEEGHIVGNHTTTHPDMTRLSGEAFAEELQGAEELYTRITGKPMPKFYRPPQGLASEENLKQAQALGYRTVFWSLAHADWDNEKQPDPAASVEKLTRRLHGGAVVLLHASSKTNAEILEELILKWQGMGYRFAPLTELFGREPDAGRL